MCGPAYTVKVPSGDNLMFHRAMELAQEGDIIVVSGVGGSERAFSGELMLSYAIARKLGGFVIDGYVRDLDGYADVDFPVYARGIQPNGPFKNGPGEINVPVAIGGQAVMPGDLLVGDADGLVVIPACEAEVIVEKGEKVVAFEAGLLAKYGASTEKPGPRKWVLDKLEASGCEVIEASWK